jgi:hypothetical protein
MSRAIEETRVVLHELKGVNLKVDFLLGTRKDLLENIDCLTYSVCWAIVDVRVDAITVTERVSGLDFCFSVQQLIIDDHVISGEVIEFKEEVNEHGVITICCKILIGRD